ncbi:MAG: carbohydrate ABC transporter permease [Firmicutes bacterium]|nr:carbohydrate ABC transporter permease [Bacillota bacterium]
MQNVEIPGGASRRFNPWPFAVLIFLTAAAVLYLVPVYVLLTTSLKSMAEVSRTSVWAIPRRPTLEAFREAGRALAPGLKNSVLLTVPATIISSFLGSLNGFALAKLRFKGADLVFAIILFGMFLPYQVVLIPLVQLLMRYRLYGSILGLMVTHVVYGLPITTLMFRNYYTAVPGELLEAARIDGAGLITFYRRILLPLSVPGFLVAVIWQFTNIWNDFLFAVTITNDPRSQPVTVALQGLAGSLVARWHVQMAGALLAALPTLVVYIFLGRYFIRGLLSGSLKG